MVSRDALASESVLLARYLSIQRICLAGTPWCKNNYDQIVIYVRLDRITTK